MYSEGRWITEMSSIKISVISGREGILLVTIFLNHKNDDETKHLPLSSCYRLSKLCFVCLLAVRHRWRASKDLDIKQNQEHEDIPI